jgi:hypothetical protein
MKVAILHRSDFVQHNATNIKTNILENSEYLRRPYYGSILIL